MKKIVSTLTAIGALAAIAHAAPASAHEPRALYKSSLHVAVGWRNEPAFANEPNAFDFIVTDSVAVTSIQLKVDVLQFKEGLDPANPKLLSTTPATGELVRDFTNPNRFNIWMLPKLAGSYGFHVTGSVNGVAVDETFICGAGTKVPGKSFGCITEPQVILRGNSDPK
jgi:hypothetical protein